MAAGCAVAAAAIAAIIIAAIFFSRRRKLANEQDSDQEEMNIVGTNSITNVMDNPLYSLMKDADDPFESDFIEEFVT